jgi:hypothetical protein
VKLLYNSHSWPHSFYFSTVGIPRFRKPIDPESFKDLQAALKAAESVSNDGNENDQVWSQKIAHYQEKIQELRYTSRLGTRTGRRLLDSKLKKFDHIRSLNIYQSVSECTGKGGMGRKHGERPVILGSTVGASLSPIFQGCLIDVIACARGCVDNRSVYEDMHYIFFKRANELADLSPRISNALFQTWDRNFMGFKEEDEQILFRNEFATIVEQVFDVQVLFATTKIEALEVWRRIEETYVEKKKKHEKRQVILGILDVGFGICGAMRVHPLAKEQQQASLQRNAELLKQQQEKIDRQEKDKEEKEQVKEREKEAKKSNLNISVDPIDMDELMYSTESRRVSTRSKTSAKKPLFTENDEDMNQGTTAAAPVPLAIPTKATTPAPSPSPAPAPVPTTIPSPNLGVVSPTLDPVNMTRFTVSSTEVPVKYRAASKDGLSVDQIARTKTILDSHVETVSIETPLSSHIFACAVQLVLDGLSPQFSISSYPKLYSNLRDAFVSASIVGREPTIGEVTDVKQEAINNAFNQYKSGDPNNIQEDRTIREHGDALIHHDNGRFFEVTFGVHVSAAKLKPCIIGHVMTYLKVTLGERLQVQDKSPLDAKIRALHFTVMDSSSLRKEVAQLIYEDFTFRFQKDVKVKDDNWEREELSEKKKSKLKKAKQFLKTFDLEEIQAFLMIFWTHVDLINEVEMEEDDDDDGSLKATRVQPQRQSKPLSFKFSQGSEDDIDDEDDDDEEEDDDEEMEAEKGVGEEEDERNEMSALFKSKATNPFEEVLHPRNPNSSHYRWGALGIYRRCIEYGKKRIAVAKEHGAWTPPSRVADELAEVETVLERPPRKTNDKNEKEEDEEDDDEEDLHDLEAHETPTVEVLLTESEREHCIRASHTCRRLPVLVPMAKQSSRFITLRSIENILPNDIISGLDRVITRIVAVRREAGGAFAGQPRPSLLFALFYLPNIHFSGKNAEREQQYLPSILFDGETLIIRTKQRSRLSSTVDLKQKALLQSRPSQGVSFELPKTASDVREEARVAEKEKNSSANKAKEDSTKAKKKYEDAKIAQTNAAQNYVDFQNEMHPGCQKCGSGGCLKDTCPCYNESGENWCVKDVCNCSQRKCGNRFGTFKTGTSCQMLGCINTAKSFPLFTCSGEDGFACGQRFHVKCKGVLYSTRCEACDPLYQEKVLAELSKKADTDFKNADADFTSAKKAVTKNPIIPAPTGTNPLDPIPKSPPQLLLGLFRATLVDMTRQSSATVSNDDELLINEINVCRTIRQTTGSVGIIDAENSTILNLLRQIPSITLRISAIVNKKMKKQKIYSIALNISVFGEEVARDAVHKLISADRINSASRYHLHKLDVDGLPTPIPSDWSNVPPPPPPFSPPPVQQSSHPQHKKDTSRQFEGGFGSDLEDSERLQHAHILRPNAVRDLGIAAQKVMELRARKDERLAALKANEAADKKSSKGPRVIVPRAVSIKEYAISSKVLEKASSRLSLIDLIIKFRGDVRIIFFDAGRRNLFFGIERRKDGTEKTWKLPRAFWRDLKGDDDRTRRGRKRMEHLSKEIEILTESPSSCSDSASFLIYMRVAASVREAIMKEKLRPIWRLEKFQAHQARHRALDEYIATIERGEPNRGTGGKSHCIIVFGDGGYSTSNAPGSRSGPTVAVREAFITKFGADSFIEITEHRSTKCCNGCGCILAKLYTDDHSHFSQRKFAKKLEKKEADFSSGKISEAPDRYQHSRRIEGIVKCVSSEDRCPLFGGRIINRDGVAALSIGDAFYTWFNGEPVPIFMEKRHHPEDIPVASINVTRGSSPFLRLLKQFYPRPVLDRIINSILLSIGIPTLLTDAMTAFLTGDTISQKVLRALIAYFTPILSSPNLSDSNEHQMKEKEEEEVNDGNNQFDAPDIENNDNVSTSSSESDDEMDSQEAKADRRAVRKEKAEGLSDQANNLFNESRIIASKNAALLSSSAVLSASQVRSSINANKFKEKEAKFRSDAAVASEAADIAMEAATDLLAASLAAQAGSNAAQQAIPEEGGNQIDSNAALLTSSAALSASGISSSTAAQEFAVIEAASRAEAVKAIKSANAAKKASDALLAASLAAQAGSIAAQVAYSAANERLSTMLDKVGALLDEANLAAKSTDEEGSSPSSSSTSHGAAGVIDLDTINQSSLIGHFVQLGNRGTTSDYETASQQSQLQSQSSYGQGQALGPEGLSLTQNLKRVNADSGSSKHTPSLGAQGTNSAGSHSGASYNTGNKGRDHGKMDTEERDKEEENELTSLMSSQDMVMSTTESTDQSQQSTQQSLYPPTSSPRPSPG